MSDISRLNSGGSIRLNTQNQHSRQTPRNDFGSMVRRGVANGAGAMGQAAGVAAPFIPGAAVVSASMEQVAGAVAPRSDGAGNLFHRSTDDSGTRDEGSGNASSLAHGARTIGDAPSNHGTEVVPRGLAAVLILGIQANRTTTIQTTNITHDALLTPRGSLRYTIFIAITLGGLRPTPAFFLEGRTGRRIMPASDRRRGELFGPMPSPSDHRSAADPQGPTAPQPVPFGPRLHPPQEPTRRVRK